MNLITPPTNLVLLENLPVFAADFAKTLKAGDRICLSGVIGAGKTTFLFQVAHALAIPKDAGFSSPTFTILNRYHTNGIVVNHVDLYRLNSYVEFENLDLVPYLEEENSITFVEWGEKFPELKNFFSKIIHFELTDQPDERVITITSNITS